MKFNIYRYHGQCRRKACVIQGGNFFLNFDAALVTYYSTTTVELVKYFFVPQTSTFILYISRSVSVWLIIGPRNNSERSEECIDFTMIITSRNNAPISKYGGGFRCKSEYPWCIIE
ncbi:Uncharacterized protein FWK35_00009494, partial [Aphis craccivora]